MTTRIDIDKQTVTVSKPQYQTSVIVRGPQGIQGATGPVGPSGPQGAAGGLTQGVGDARYEKKMVSQAAAWYDAGAVGTDGARLIDLTGKGRDAIFGSSGAAPTVLPFAGETYLHMPYFTASPAMSNAVNTPMSVNAYVPSKVVVTKRDDPIRHGYSTTNSWSYFQVCSVDTNDRGWLVSLRHSDGHFVSQKYTVGGTANEALSLGVPTAGLLWRRFTFNAGTVTYEESADRATWTVKATVQHAQTTFANSNATQLVPKGNMSYSPPAGSYVYAEFAVDDQPPTHVFDIRNVVLPDAKVVPNKGTHGGDFALVRATGAARLAVVDRPLLRFDGSQHMTALAGKGLDMRTVVFAFRQFQAGVGLMYLWDGDSQDGTKTGGAAWHYNDNTSVNVRGLTASGTLSTSGVPAAYGQTVIASVVTVGSSLRVFVDGKYYNGFLGNLLTPLAQRLRVGYQPGTGMPFEFIAMAVFERALSDAEVAQVSADLTGIPHTLQTDPHPGYVLESQVGNLLTAEQASVEDVAGFAGSYCTISRSTAWAGYGSASIRAVQTGGTYYQVNVPIPIELWRSFVGRTITAVATVNGDSAANTGAYMMVGSSLRNYSPSGTQPVPAVGSPRQVAHTFVVPADEANATSADIKVTIACPGGGAAYVDRIGLWLGAGGDWAMPGSPITNLGIQKNPLYGFVEAWNGTAWVKVEDQWETVPTWSALSPSGNWPGRRIKVSDGLGLCIALWNGTGWVVAPESDTGLRNITLENGWTASFAALQRIGNTVWIHLTSANGSAATSATLYTAPGGFRTGRITNVPVSKEAAPATIGILNIAVTGVIAAALGTMPTYTGVRCLLPLATSDAWPTTAPA